MTKNRYLCILSNEKLSVSYGQTPVPYMEADNDIVHGFDQQQRIFWGKSIQRVEGEEGITCIAELTNRLVQSEFETA